MICNTCGRNIQNEEANFCEYCGSPFREHMQSAFHIDSQIPREIQTDTSEKPISFLNWLGINGILFGSLLIPYIGPIIALVVLATMSFGNKASESKKNWARATLLCGTIYFVIMVCMLILIVISSPLFKELMNGSIDMNSLNQSLYQK